MPSFKSSLLVAVAALMSPALVSAALDETLYPYQAPDATASRSPCPGLNALANHGILPRDGKNIDLATLIKATALGFNLAADATTIVGTVGLASSTTGNASTFHLKDLNQHDPQVIEHDGSMSRNDVYFGDSLKFSDEAWARTLASWGDSETITFKIAKTERAARFAWGKANNPDFNQTFAESGSLLEYALALSAFGDPVEGNAKTAYLKYLIEEERLPTKLGWQPPTKQATWASGQVMAKAIATA